MNTHDEVDDAIEERTARLQRIAYGADASEAERAEAAAQLAALRGRPDAVGAGPVERAAAPRPADEPGTPDEEHDHRRVGTERRRIGVRPGTRRTLAFSSAALGIGVVIGLWVGTGVGPSATDGGDVPVAETVAWEVFERPATDGDVAQHPGPLVDLGTDDSTRRLLLTRSDGVRLIAVRTTDGENACLILALPVGRPATACTEDGRFPLEGIRAEISVQGVGVYLAGWRPDGQADINTADAPTG
ncbi:hypothetical protein [Agromyces arachidis]|uniref:hypothetical protein n=1 Tax=Agromyces arachidis TaxID=766966 RepID=UPI004056595B